MKVKRRNSLATSSRWSLATTRRCLASASLLRDLQNEKMVKKLDEQSPQTWQWLVGIDYAKVFVDLVYKHGYAILRQTCCAFEKNGTSFDHGKTTWNSNSALPRKLMELLGIVLSEFKAEIPIIPLLLFNNKKIDTSFINKVLFDNSYRIMYLTINLLPIGPRSLTSSVEENHPLTFAG